MATAVLGVQEKVRPAWIVSGRADLLWFTVGGAASAYVFWALWRFTHVPLIVLVAIWAVVFDETHGFATISRTYLDAQERQRRGRWLWWSLAFFVVVGPILILCHLGNVLELVTVLWAYYHVFKQHYGFMMMYKKKNRDFKPEDMKLDKVFFAVAFCYSISHLPPALQASGCDVAVSHRAAPRGHLSEPFAVRGHTGHAGLCSAPAKNGVKGCRSTGPNKCYSLAPFPSITCSFGAPCPYWGFMPP